MEPKASAGYCKASGLFGITHKTGFMKKRRKTLIIFGIVVAVIFLLIYIFYDVVAYTPNAYIRANWVEIAPRIKGHIKCIYIKNNQHVEKNQILMEIEEYPYQLVLNVRTSTLNQNEAQLKIIKIKYEMSAKELKDREVELNLMLIKAERYKKLMMANAVSKQQYEDVLKSLEETKVKLTQSRDDYRYWQASVGEQMTVIDACKANVAMAEYDLAMCKIRAPNAGYITNMYVRPGDFAGVGKALFGIVEKDDWWVEANYKECFVGKIKPGQKVLIQCDLHPFRFFEGEVVSIGRGVNRTDGPEKTLPYIKPTIDWVRLQYRFPVRIRFTNLPDDIRLRMSADVRTMVFLWTRDDNLEKIETLSAGNISRESEILETGRPASGTDDMTLSQDIKLDREDGLSPDSAKHSGDKKPASPSVRSSGGKKSR